MFKKFALIAATSMLLAASQASASITPSGAVTVTVTGTVSQSVTLTCSKSFPATVNSATNTITVHTTGQNFGSGTCGLVTFTSDWNVAATPVTGGATLNVTNIKANTLTGSCTQVAGNVVAGTWTNPAGGTAGKGQVSGSIGGVSFGAPKACNLNITSLTSSPDLTIL